MNTVINTCLSHFLLIVPITVAGEIIPVSSQDEFDMAHDTAAANDTIMWNDGTYRNIIMDIDNSNLYITAETRGRVIFTGSSRVLVDGDFVTLDGFQFLDGNIGTNHVISITGSNNVFTQLNIKGYTCHKYFIVREQSQFCDITYCNFENRLNLDDQNILSILVDNDQPGFHKIQHCSFKNFDGTGNDLGIEPIRIGVSSQANFNSRSTVEYCYFTQCNGDGEIISSKASQNIYRHNTFEDNPRSELVLRHGSENIVYGNFFINGKDGVRVREGRDHYIYNNYFYRLRDRAILLQNEDADPLINNNIAFNTVVDCAAVALSESGNDKPSNVTLANNIFTDPDNNLFSLATGEETWLGNIAFGNMGINSPSEGITNIDPLLTDENGGTLLGLDSNSPAINAAVSGYPSLPNYEGIDSIDTEIERDLMGQVRPTADFEKDLGSNEHPHNIAIQPIATEENTGPDYDSDSSTSVQETTFSTTPIIKLKSTISLDYLTLDANSEGPSKLELHIITRDSQLVQQSLHQINSTTSLSLDIRDLPSGHYFIKALRQQEGRELSQQTVRFFKG